MPRRGFIPKRDVLPDPLYNDKVVTRLINNIMLDGKKGVAQKIVYDAFDIIREKTGKEPLEVFNQAMENIMPVLEVKARRVGGATYQVPMEVRPERRQTLGLRWLTSYSRSRNERSVFLSSVSCPAAADHSEKGRVLSPLLTNRSVPDEVLTVCLLPDA